MNFPQRIPNAKHGKITASEIVHSNSTSGGKDCWEWQSYRDAKGYGRSVPRFGEVLAHRISYRVFKGEIPDGLHVLHSCDNPCCVNPDHLRVGTNDDNVLDRHERNRWASMPGDENPNAKLSWQEALEIRDDPRSQSRIADAYGVSQSTVSMIKLEKIWRVK